MTYTKHRNKQPSPICPYPLNGMAKEIASEVLDVPSHFRVVRRERQIYWRVTAAVLAFTSLLWWSRSWIPSITPRICTGSAVVPGSDVPDVGFNESFLRSWAQYSPYIPVAGYIPPPPGCVVTQVSSICLSPDPELTNRVLGKPGMQYFPFLVLKWIHH